LGIQRPIAKQPQIDDSLLTTHHLLAEVQYLVEPGKGFEFHTQEFIDGYIDGFCDSSPPGRGSDTDEATFNFP
jgi:hypothetical protein